MFPMAMFASIGRSKAIPGFRPVPCWELVVHIQVLTKQFLTDEGFIANEACRRIRGEAIYQRVSCASNAIQLE